jgi:hypothetical protein
VSVAVHHVHHPPAIAVDAIQETPKPKLTLPKALTILALAVPRPKSRSFRPFAFLRSVSDKPPSRKPRPESEANIRTIMHADDPTIPPTKAHLKAWWHHFNFTQKVKKDAEANKQGMGISTYSEEF